MGKKRWVNLGLSLAFVLTLLAPGVSFAQGGNLRALHNPTSPQYNGNCLDCHADILPRKTLNANIPEAHAAMLPYVPGYPTGKPLKAGTANEHCRYCHKKGVDFDRRSAASLRKNVSSETCSICHGRRGLLPIYRKK